MNLMDIYGDGEGVSEAQFRELKGEVRQRMRDKGLIKSSGGGVFNRLVAFGWQKAQHRVGKSVHGKLTAGPGLPGWYFGCFAPPT